MWVQTGGPPNQPVIFFDYSTSRAQEVPSRLLAGYRGYLMTDDYAGYNAQGVRPGVERMGRWAHARRKFVEAQKVHPKGKTGRADIALNLINKLYGIERDLKEVGDEHLHESRRQNSLPVLAQLHTWLEKTQPQVTAQNALGKASTCQQLDQVGALHRSRLLVDRQQCGSACDQILRYRTQEVSVQRHTQRRDGQRSTLQFGRDDESQRSRALCVAAPRTRASAASLKRRRLQGLAAVELFTANSKISIDPLLPLTEN